MFGLFKHKQQPMGEAEYQAEYRRLLRELCSQFTVGDSPREQVETPKLG
jgi:hypothetical protein